jgi:peptide/nickel transport system substrate-binding protein
MGRTSVRLVRLQGVAMSRRFWGRPTAPLVLAATLFATAVCWGVASSLAASPSPSPTGKVTLRVGWTAEPDNLNPFIGQLVPTYEIWHLNYDYLVGVKAAGYSPTPELATSWSHSADGKVWTFKLRRGVTWQDGVPFTAADVVFTFEYIIDNEMANFTNYTEYIDDVVAVDDYTVEFRCSKAKANMLGLWVPILPEHIWSKVPPKAAANTFRNAPPIIGTGPFQCVEWKKDQYVRLKANPRYWRGRPKVDEVIFETFKNANSMTQELRNGYLVAAVNVPDAQFTLLKGVSGISAVDFVQKGFVELSINSYDSPDSMGNPVLRDPAFRRALQYAMDRQAIARTAWSGYATPATSLLPSGYYKAPMDYHWDPPAGQAYTYDPARAKQALDAAGYRDANGDGIRDYKGKPIKLRLVAITNDVHATKMGMLVTSWLKQVGLGVNYEVMDDGSLYDLVWNMNGDKAAPDYDLCLWGPWTGDVDPNWIFSIFTSAQIGGWSASYYSNPEYDRLYRQQQITLDPQARKQVFLDMQRLLYEDSPVIFLVYPKLLEAYNTAKWTGWVHSPADTGGVLFTSDNIDSYLFVQPAEATGPTHVTNPSTIILGILAGVAVIAVIVWLVVSRRRRAPEEE